ncbi:TetR family transcriptional regulator [Cellulomonas sp. ICMP 17802]|uniref:TetR/AcrR family transcriptional regulator n=1 Tax=Cellulomonas sp. ICMP 17802 TaxID=3239199 RepID=UPI00351B0998
MTTTETGREAVERHARTMFEQQGYAGTSVRALATAAGVDPALVIRWFGSKEELFLRVMSLAERPLPDLGGPTGSLGERLVEFALAPDQISVRRDLTALIRASDSSSVRSRLRHVTRTLFVERLVDRLEGPHAELRAHLIASQLGGLLQSWDVAEDESLLAASRERIVALYGPAVQALIDPPTSTSPDA